MNSTQDELSFIRYSLLVIKYLIYTGYFEGIAGNLELMSTYYPGWVMRVYYDLDDNDPITQVIIVPPCVESGYKR